MLKTREELAKNITRLCKLGLSDKKILKQNINLLLEKYNIPTEISHDILTLYIDPIDQTDFVLFCVLSVLKENEVSKFFTDKEIQTYSIEQYKVATVKLPIKWKMIQVAEDQWIGTIRVKDLMLLRNAKMIKYNENAQRTLKHMTNGETEWYQIDVNREAVNAIVESYNNETYIPNTITLNIPETSEFHYDGDTLIINEIDGFDILDGYHRYISMSQIYNQNKRFDYTMELRVVSFSDEKARQFIWQEDQKTKMNKIDSDALNQNNPANQVVQMLSTKGILSGLISRNKGIIDASLLSQLISVLFFNTRNKIERKQIISTRDLIYNKLEVLIENNTKLLDKKWKSEYVAACLFIIYKQVDDDSLEDEVNTLYELLCREENKDVITGRTFTQMNASRLNKLFEGRI